LILAQEPFRLGLPYLFACASLHSPVVLVGIGSVEAAKAFADDIGLSTDPTLKDKILLVTDETGSVTEALDCYRGWLTVDKKHKERYPFTDVHAAIKLLGMIFGFGSPRTIDKVLQGYTGDTSNNYGVFGRQWVIQALIQGGEKGRFPRVDVSLDSQSKLKPFELATLRLQTGLHIVQKWGKLGPKDGDLFTRMGGTFVFDNKRCVYEHFDQGILNFANMDDICLVAEAAVKGESYIVPSSISLAKKNRQALWARRDQEMKVRLTEAAKQAEYARLKEERLAREAKLAEEARLVELDMIEAERIAEMARQGQEAKMAKEAKIQAEERANEDIERATSNKETKKSHVAALKFETRDKLQADEGPRAALEAEERANEQTTKAISDPQQIKDYSSLSVEDLLKTAEEQEQRIRASLEAIQNVQKVSATDGQEKFLRNLLAARIKYEKNNVKSTGMIVNGESEPAGLVFDVPSKPVVVKIGKIVSKQPEAFQRRLLAAQFDYRQRASNNHSTPSINETLESFKKEEPRDNEDSLHRGQSEREQLLARGPDDHATATEGLSKITISTLDSTDDMISVAATNEFTSAIQNVDDKSELFQRRLLATRLAYERTQESKNQNYPHPHHI
jgi:hypothetical protein